MKSVGHKRNENSKPIVSATLDDHLLAEIENVRFERRLNSRSEAMEYILALGLKVLEKRKEKKLAASG